MLPISSCSSRWAPSSCRAQHQHCLLPTPGIRGSDPPFLYFNRPDQNFTSHLPKLLQICSAEEHPHYPLDPVCLLQSHKWRIKCCISPHYWPPNWGSSSFHSSQQLESEKNLWHFDDLLLPLQQKSCWPWVTSVSAQLLWGCGYPKWNIASVPLFVQRCYKTECLLKQTRTKSLAYTGLTRMESDSSFALEVSYASWLTNTVNKLTIALFLATVISNSSED